MVGFGVPALLAHLRVGMRERGNLHHRGEWLGRVETEARAYEELEPVGRVARPDVERLLRQA